MISNRDIDSVLTSACPKTYRGCYASDTLPKQPFKTVPASLVVNISKHTIPEGHFVAIHETASAVYYFDPLGISSCSPYYSPSICNFLTRTRKKIISNVVPIQNISSNYCGYFCIAYILFCNKISPNFDKFISLFERSSLHNDEMSLEIIKMLQ